MELNNTDVVNEVLLKKQDKHLLHCFDYLRQGIMCAGDMTLEWPKEQKVGDGSKVDGWGVEHQCKSWVSILLGVLWKTADRLRRKPLRHTWRTTVCGISDESGINVRFSKVRICLPTAWQFNS